MASRVVSDGKLRVENGSGDGQITIKVVQTPPGIMDHAVSEKCVL